MIYYKKLFKISIKYLNKYAIIIIDNKKQYMIIKYNRKQDKKASRIYYGLLLFISKLYTLLLDIIRYHII